MRRRAYPASRSSEAPRTYHHVHTARPGIVIGRGGQRVDELRKAVEGAVGGKRVRLNVLEIRQPELDAFLVARNVADQLERRVMFPPCDPSGGDAVHAGRAKGIKVMVSGRLGGAEIARNEKVMDGRVPLHTLRADIDYGLAEASTTMGRIGVKVWVYRGDILPDNDRSREPEPEASPEAIAAAQEALAAQDAGVMTPMSAMPDETPAPAEPVTETTSSVAVATADDAGEEADASAEEN